MGWEEVPPRNKTLCVFERGVGLAGRSFVALCLGEKTSGLESRLQAVFPSTFRLKAVLRTGERCPMLFTATCG